VCENARVAVRNTRGKGVKEIKSDVDGKIVSKEEARNDTKKVSSMSCAYVELD
jgi:ribosome recycling factor